MRILKFIETGLVWIAITACVLTISMLVIYVLGDLIVNPLIEWIFK